MKHSDGKNTSFEFQPKSYKNVYFLLQNIHLKPKICLKTIGNANFKHVFVGTMILHLQSY
jgi:hypothetical protein